MESFAVIVVAAGKSSRFGGPQRKTEIEVDGLPIWWHAVRPFLGHPQIIQTILVGPSEGFDAFQKDHQALLSAAPITLVPGGAERFHSVELGLNAVRPDIEWVVVHDGARPCIDGPLVQRVLDAAQEYQAAIAAIPVVATLKRSQTGEFVDATVDRSGLWQAQTPQAYRKTLLQRAFADRGELPATDESQLVEQLGVPVKIVAGSPWNIKITLPEDLVIARQFLNGGK